MKRVRLPDLAPAPATGATMPQDELVSLVQHLAAQRTIDQEAWAELVEVLGDHAARVEAIEHEDLQHNDRSNLLAAHCRALTKETDGNLRAQLDAYSTEVQKSLVSLESKLQGTIIGAQEKFDKNEVQLTATVVDAQKLVEQIDAKILQIQAKLLEHDCRFQNIPGPGPDKEKFLKAGTFNAPQAFDIGTPVKAHAGGDAGTGLPQGCAL